MYTLESVACAILFLACSPAQSILLACGLRQAQRALFVQICQAAFPGWRIMKSMKTGAAMDAITQELTAFLDREKIRDCLARLARGEDRRDPELISACCWPDSTSDYGVFRGTFKEYLAWVVPGSPAIAVTQHALGQSVIDLESDAALAETQVTSYHRINMGTEERDIVIGGRYLDRLEKRSGDWRIAKRTMLYDWFQDLGASVDLSKGVLGMPFSAAHFAGRTLGDYSETFFGKGTAKRSR
jgi:hypothetical protein